MKSKHEINASTAQCPSEAALWSALGEHWGHKLTVEKTTRPRSGEKSFCLVCASCGRTIAAPSGPMPPAGDFSASSMRRLADANGHLDELFQDVLGKIKETAAKGETEAMLCHLLPSWKRVRSLGLDKYPKEEPFIPMLEQKGYRVIRKREYSNGVLQDPTWYVRW